MTWIGGILSKVNTGQSEFRRKLAVMMEAACPSNGHSIAAYPRCCMSATLDDTHGQALVQLPVPTEGVPSEHVYTDYREKLALLYDGHLYGLKNTASKPSQVQQNTNETAAEFVARLLPEIPGNLEQKVERALTGLDGNYALVVSDTDQIVISRDSLGTRPLYFAGNSQLLAFASNKKPLWKIGLDEVRPLRAGMLAVLDHDRLQQEASMEDRLR